jgi:hypothetical protein
MKTQLLSLIFCAFLAACGNTQATEKRNPDASKDSMQASTDIPADPHVAVRFLNAYIKSTDKTADWLKKCGLVTDDYIAGYTTAQKKQQGEGGEPIDLVTGNMDWCETGYVLRKFDASIGYVLASGSSEISGCDEKFDPVVLKIVQVGDKWLVDGSGAVNLPAGAYETFK